MYTLEARLLLKFVLNIAFLSSIWCLVSKDLSFWTEYVEFHRFLCVNKLDVVKENDYIGELKSDWSWFVDYKIAGISHF